MLERMAAGRDMTAVARDEPVGQRPGPVPRRRLRPVDRALLPAEPAGPRRAEHGRAPRPPRRHRGAAPGRRRRPRTTSSRRRWRARSYDLVGERRPRVPRAAGRPRRPAGRAPARATCSGRRSPTGWTPAPTDRPAPRPASGGADPGGIPLPDAFPTYGPGRTIDQLAVGDSASLERTFSQDDIDAFARISGDDNPAHVDAAWAEASIFGGRVAHGVLTAGLISAVLGTKLPGPGSIYLSQTLKWLAPVQAGRRAHRHRDGPRDRGGEEPGDPRHGRDPRRRHGAHRRGADHAARRRRYVIRRMAVLGAGVMGSEIAQTAAAGGVEVVLFDADPAALERGMAHVAKIGERRVARGRMSEEEAQADPGPRDHRDRRRRPRRLRPGDRGGPRGDGHQAPGLPPPRRGAAAARAARHQHVGPLGQRDGRRDGPAGAGGGPPLLQPGERDEAGRGDPRHDHQRGHDGRRPRRWPRRSARCRSGCASARASWSTGSWCARCRAPTGARPSSAPTWRPPTPRPSRAAPRRWARSPSAT